MRPTALVYSSHDRCEYIHREFIIKRALENPDNKTIFHLSMSEELFISIVITVNSAVIYNNLSLWTSVLYILLE
jgi:hypothetical protein